MAPSLKQFSGVLFVFIFASFCVEARQSKFFKGVMVSHSIKMSSSPLLETPIGAPAPAPVSGADDDFPPVPFESGIGFVPVPAPAPAPALALAPTPAFFESDNPYGLYGASGDEESAINPNEEFSSSNEGTEIPNDHEFNNERLTDFNTEKPFNNNNNYNSNYNNNGYSNNYYSNNNNNYNRNNNNNGYSNNYYSNNNNGYSSSNFYSNGYTNGYNGNGNGNGNGYESSERQGMSDTRFLENGKYSYEPNKENYNNQNEIEPEKRSSSNGGYYGEKSRYEFDSMEVYERQQGYP